MEGGVPLRRILLSGTFVLATVMIGTGGYMVLEEYSFVDAIYMTIITMSTVGYGEVQALSGAGKIFSVFLITISVGSFVYAITTITTFVVEGEMQHIFNRYQVNQQVAKLKNHIIICGLGRNGRESARELTRQEIPFVVIEQSEEVIKDFMESDSALMIQGDATHEEILEKANIQNARGLISALATDAENVFITLTARGMNSKLKIVARASNESAIPKLMRAGANEVILPNLIGGRNMANVLTRPALMEFIELVSGYSTDNPLHLEDIACGEHSSLLGHTLAELGIRSKTGVLVLGFKRGINPIELNPNAHLKIEKDDRLFVVGAQQQLDHFHEKYLS